MNTKPTELTRWNTVCEEYGHESYIYVVAGDGYGRLLGRTPKNELALFDVWDNGEAFEEELSGLVHELMRRDAGIARCFQKVLGLVCDLAPSGHHYSFTGKVWCPVCGSPNVHYTLDDPPRVDVVALPHASHSNWDKLSPRMKRELVANLLKDIGCLPWEKYLENYKAGRLDDW